jgi:formylglycine-generating enzyme required for sulfatase activity
MGNNPSSFAVCGDECPVETINWYEAVAYANARSRSEGLDECYVLSGCSGSPGDGMECSSVTFAGLECRAYRLPTEAEWEYAARAGTTTALYNGRIEILSQSSAPALQPIAWYGGNSGVSYADGYDCSDWSERPDSADRCGPHPVGRKEPNAWGLYDMLGNVWEWVWDGYSAYPTNSVVDPLGSSEAFSRGLRGGSWFNVADLARCARRNRNMPGVRYPYNGFRLARSAF